MSNQEASVAARRPLLDAAAAAEYIGITERHVRRLVYDRKIPKVKIGGRLMFDPVKLDAWIEANSADPEAS